MESDRKNIKFASEESENKVKHIKGKIYYLSDSHGTYWGETIYDKNLGKRLKNGKGKFQDKDGNIYEGNWKNDKKDGEGTYYYNDGDKYVGDWKNDKKDGEGIFYYNNGDIYKGEFKNDKRDGKGKFQDKDGNIYEGEWKNDKKYEEKIFYYDNGDIYKGEVKNDKKDGEGTYYYKNGYKYVGNWKNDKKDGKGTYYYDDEDEYYVDRYEGDWKNDDKDGKGIYYYNNGDKYEGDWKNGERDGKGIYYYNDGDKYVGDWKNGEKDGKGTYYCNDGARYEGDWENDERNGEGIFYYKNGDKYVGDWKNSERDGKGTYYDNHGNKYVGDWKNGERDGKGIFYDKEGYIYEGNYKNGILINGKKYNKSMPEKRKDVFLQINEFDGKEKFLSKHKDGDFIYTDDRIDKTVTHEKETYDHLKILYDDHGNQNRKLTKNIDQKNFTEYQKKKLKSVYISSGACHGGFWDSKDNDLFNIIEDMMKNSNDNCVGFVSLTKAKNVLAYNKTTNKNGKNGVKRIPLRKENTENLSDPNYDKNNDFEYYCIIKEEGEYKKYQIPYQLCYWREKLIDENKFMEAFNALKEGKDYKFEAEVILNDGKSTKTKMEITIPCKWGKNKENEVNIAKFKKPKIDNSKIIRHKDKPCILF